MHSRIKRGEIHECLFGRYKPLLDAQGRPSMSTIDGMPEYIRDDFQGPIPYEIHKPRPVVILGDHKGQYLVVPISTTQDRHQNPRKTGEAKGIHIRLAPADVPALSRYRSSDLCWAKANMIQTVDRNRLKPLNMPGQPAPRVSAECLSLIQRAVIRSIGCQGLLDALDTLQLNR
jgi:uncharacterized protein YifN (PemK superfamily)